jgi:hypothetical protein
MTEEGNKQSSEDFSSWKRRATMVNYLLEGGGGGGDMNRAGGKRISTKTTMTELGRGGKREGR